MTDPFEALRGAAVPVAPAPDFAAALRARLTEALSDLASPEDPTNQEAQMDKTTATDDVLLRDETSRNGTRHGDISYISLGVSDAARARAFYGIVLGWRFAAGRIEAGNQVDDVVPQVGLWTRPAADLATAQAAVLAFRVDDIAAALDVVRAQGGTATDVIAQPYGLSSECRDNQGLGFYLHQLPEPGRRAPENGIAHGDISYVSLLFPDGDRALAFYGAVLGWEFSPTPRTNGWSVEGPIPMTGMAGGSEQIGAILAYRVDDLEAAVTRIRDAGGLATEPASRPYGLESDCRDDQGIAFYLHQFPDSPPVL